MATIDVGALAGGYLGLLLLGGSVVAMGMFFSSTTDNQVVALVMTFAASLALFLAGLWATAGPDDWLVQASLATHVTDALRGVLRLSDLAYFGVFIGFFVFATHQRMESLRWR